MANPKRLSGISKSVNYLLTFIDVTMFNNMLTFKI